MAIQKKPTEQITYSEWLPPDHQEEEALKTLFTKISDEGNLIGVGTNEIHGLNPNLMIYDEIPSTGTQTTASKTMQEKMARDRLSGATMPSPWGQSASGLTQSTQPPPYLSQRDHLLELNMKEFSRIKNRIIIDIGIVAPKVFISLVDGGVLTVEADELCDIADEGNLSGLNGHHLGDIAVNPHYSIAGRMKCTLSIYSRHGHAVNLGVFASVKPDFKLHYRQP
jgi:hypothetical protein